MSISTRTRAFAALGMVLAVAASGCASSAPARQATAAASPTGPTTPSPDNGREARAAFRAWVEALPADSLRGDVALFDEAEYPGVLLLWQRDKLEDTFPIVAEARRRGIDLEVVERRFSAEELNLSCKQVAQHELALHELGFKLTSLGCVRDDFDDITLSGRPDSTAAAWAVIGGPASAQSPRVQELDGKIVKVLKAVPTPARIYWEPASEAAIQESGV